jgi:hypothetical protein
MMLGMVFAMRHEQKRERQPGSLTDLASVHGLGAQVERLKQDSRRLRRERDELLSVLTQITRLLERCDTIPGTINSKAIRFSVQASEVPPIGG